MTFTRRHALATGGAAIALAAGITVLPFRARAASDTGSGAGGDMFETDTGEMTVNPISHASLVLETPGPTIYVDPVGDPAAYDGLPGADLILITHEHGDHYNADTLKALVGEGTKLVTNPAVHDMLPEDLKSRATALANGDSTTVAGVSIDAIPAYNLTEERKKYHPKGRDNGYVLGIDGRRVYIAGDTEDIPEMRALENIDVAFLPMNLPYTMEVEKAAAAVKAFKPAYVYPYHYKGSDTEAFASLVMDGDGDTEVMLHDWYAGA